MGASEWISFVPYQEDIGAALERERLRAFGADEYFWYESVGPRPNSLAELLQDEAFKETGAHTVIDAEEVLGEDEEPDYGCLIPLDRDYAAELFGTDRPSRAQFESSTDPWQVIVERHDTGRYQVLYDGDTPNEIVFWGISGD